MLLVDVFLRDDQRNVTYVLAMLALIGTAGDDAAYFGVTIAVHRVQRQLRRGSGRRGVLKMFAYIIVGIVFLYSREHLERNGLLKGEFFLLGLFGLLGIMIMISANSLLTLYLGLEVLALVAVHARRVQSRLGRIRGGGDEVLRARRDRVGHAALRHLAALRAHGHARSSTSSRSISRSRAASACPRCSRSRSSSSGVAFKFGAVPFHMWVPDVYQGAPTPVTLYIGSAPEIAAFALTWRVLVEGLGPLHDPGWQDMLIVLSVLSLGFGNMVAIAQTNLKRMLAYSTISHVGFILMGFIAGTHAGVQRRDVLHVRLRADGGRGLRHDHPAESRAVSRPSASRTSRA